MLIRVATTPGKSWHWLLVLEKHPGKLGNLTKVLENLFYFVILCFLFIVRYLFCFKFLKKCFSTLVLEKVKTKSPGIQLWFCSGATLNIQHQQKVFVKMKLKGFLYEKIIHSSILIFMRIFLYRLYR